MLEKSITALVAVAMILVGILHFMRPDPFVRIVPSALPYPLALVYISGLFEVVGGAGLLHQKTRQWASWGLIALYIAVFPANVNMAINDIQLEAGGDIPRWGMWARLPLQAVFIAVVWWVGRPRNGKE